jgi:hypothetical protein
MPDSTNPNGVTDTRVVSDGKAVGYEAGVGAAVTQLSTRATAVTINAVCGTITTDDASLAAEGTADFIVTNSFVEIGDVVNICMQSGSDGGGTLISVAIVTDGTFTIRTYNGNVASGTAETGPILINFIVTKAVSA